MLYKFNINTSDMEQMNIDENKRIAYDLSKASEEVQKLEPVVFQEGGSYCCLLGPNPQAGIFGFMRR